MKLREMTSYWNGQPGAKLRSAVILASLLFVVQPAFAQSDTSRVVPADSSGYNPNQLAEGQKRIGDYLAKHFGFDLFATGEVYSLHFSRVSFLSSSGGVGMGAELRIAPVFIGGIFGESGNEIPRPPSEFYFSSLYAGFMISGYRIDVGKIYGETQWLDQDSPPVAVYNSLFAGIGRRYGSGFFFEPEIKFMFPVTSTYYYYANQPGIMYNGPNAHTAVGRDNGGLRDLFLAFSIKVGLCLGSGD